MTQSLEMGVCLGGGRYVVERVLGVGGFGITYYVMHQGLGSHYAIKEFFIDGKCIRGLDGKTVVPQGIDDSVYLTWRDKFSKEAQTVASLSHPHVVKVTDVFTENNTSYIVMDYVEGVTLQQFIERNGRMDFDFAVNCMGQLSEAVAYIHHRHILHRDIKPDNIILKPDNQVVLIDFGSAREFVHDEVQRHTTILTHGYAPIEQYSATSKKGNYTDIYALGGVLYFLLTGQRPMDANVRSIEQMPSPYDLNPTIPYYVSQTIMKAMEFQPEKRYQTVDAFMSDLLGGGPLPPPLSPGNDERKRKKGKAGMIIGIVASGIATVLLTVLALRALFLPPEPLPPDPNPIFDIPVQVNTYVIINAHELRLRYGPSTDYDMLKKPDGTQRYVTRDEKLLYKDETPDFYKIEFYDGREFWVARKFAKCVQGSPTDDWETERRVRGLVSDFMMMEEMPSGSSGSLIRQLYAPHVERYFGNYNETVDEVAQHYANYDSRFGVYGKHSKVRWNTLSYYKMDNRYVVTFVEDYSIDRYDESKYSVFVLEKHLELNSDFKVVRVYDVQLEKRVK